MNIRKPVANPFGEPPKRPVVPETVSAPRSVELPPPPANPTPMFPTSGVMKPSTPATILPPLPARPQTGTPFTSLPSQPDAVPEIPEPVQTFEEGLEDAAPLSEEEEMKLRKISLSVDDGSVPQTLYALATDEDWTVRDAVASNPNTPESILLALSKDENDMVRQSVMENPSISEALLASFAEDENTDILIEFIDFERTTVDMLRPLFRHDDDEVIDFLMNSEKLPAAEKFNLRRI